MSPASYRTAPPRVGSTYCTGARSGPPNRLVQQVEGLRYLGPGLVVEADPLRSPAVGQRLVGSGEVALRALEQRVGFGHVALAVLVAVPVVVSRAGVAGVRRGRRLGPSPGHV